MNKIDPSGEMSMGEAITVVALISIVTVIGPLVMLMPMKVRGASTLSDDGVHFIAVHEGFRSRLYNDAAGNCTIGFGHLVHMGACNGTEPANFRTGITRAEGEQLLSEDAEDAVAAVRTNVTVPLAQYEFDAIVDFTFNLGEGALNRSTLRRELNTRNYQAVPNEMMRFVNAGGRPLPGLVTRRNDEAQLWRTGNYE